ncbi:Pol polyprotein [Plakobranchus ocellatus]|uniref:Pol polyprotein n=1 Tax=Plakobranchus ocellatus TaxID=259542 RepID=A0AAV4DTW9_9GAST|nr:Pol polyprotein [Plakobranchus ocellatus]
MLPNLDDIGPKMAGIREKHSRYSEPLADLLKKDRLFSWCRAQQKAFDAVKEHIDNARARAFYNPKLETVVSADSSSYGIGVCLMQKRGDKLFPIAFASSILNEAEKRYAQTEKECLAPVWASEKFAKYQTGLYKFGLQTIGSTYEVKGYINLQFLMRLLRFNSEVVHVPGKRIAVADTLSRQPVAHTAANEEMETDCYVKAYFDSVT